MSEPYEIEQPEPRHTVHVWEGSANEYGPVWACVAYDHGPMCRRCQPVDGMLMACLQAVAEGLLEAWADNEGKFQFRVSKKGVAAMESLQATPEGAELWAHIQNSLGEGE
jgi:hypothetical protein